MASIVHKRPFSSIPKTFEMLFDWMKPGKAEGSPFASPFLFGNSKPLHDTLMIRRMVCDERNQNAQEKQERKKNHEREEYKAETCEPKQSAKRADDQQGTENTQ